MDNLGFVTLIPLLLLLVLVVTTKRVLPSMIIALVPVFILKDGIHFLTGFTDTFYDVFAEGTYPWVMLMLCLFGALIQLLIKSGGTAGFRKLALRYIKSERSSVVFTWILGLVLCIDDYINDLAIGPSVRTITDRYNVPREGIGFIIVSMGVPICALLPVTAMAVFVFGVMQDTGVSSANASMLTEMLKVIPYLFYPMAIILIALLFALGVIPKIGPMKKVFQQSRDKAVPAVMQNAGEEPETEDDGTMLDFIIPVLVVIGFMLATNDLVISVIIALAVAFVLYVFRKKMKVDEYFEHFIEGVLSMIEILIIILLTFIFVSGLDAIGLNDYVIGTVTPYLTGGAIPVLAFIVVALLAYLGVDYWAVMLLMGPIVIPLAEQFSISPYLGMAAVVSGAICGGTTCFFGEQMLMCGQSVERKSIELAPCVLPYGIIAFVLSAVLYIILGVIS